MKTVLGLTGGSGAGKSAAAACLAARGATVIDADKIARRILEPGTPALARVASSFADVLLPDGSLNRKKLASLVFSDSAALEKLNALTHTYIIQAIEDALEQSTEKLTVIDAPLLFECGLERICTACVCILADRSLRIQRIMARDGLSEKEAQGRIDAQHDDAYFRSRCRFVIENNGSQEALEQALDVILKELLF